MKKIFFSLAFAGLFCFSNAQVKTPAPSPASTVKQTVGLSEITIDYSRPSAKDREIFGNLVPFNQLWRTGANASTDIHFSTDVNFGGTDVKAGKYALYTIPNQNEWEIILYQDTEQWGAPESLDDKLVLVRCKAKTQPHNPFVETFTIGFDDLRNESANLSLVWANTLVEVPIIVDVNKEVLASIEKTMNGPSANDYHQAASYYLDEKMDLEKALTWSQKAEELRPDAFWMIKTQSEIFAAKGDYKNAIATAERSLALAKKANYAPYIKMNEENIEKWRKK